MTQEEKQLLITDLCARLPYGVMINSPSNIFMPSEREDVKLDSIFEINGEFYATEDNGWPINTIKPYLRPLSSMTEEEEVEYDATFDTIHINGHYDSCMSYKSFDFLNKKMFDYRGLIPIGLALEALEGMY